MWERGDLRARWEKHIKKQQLSIAHFSKLYLHRRGGARVVRAAQRWRRRPGVQIRSPMQQEAMTYCSGFCNLPDARELAARTARHLLRRWLAAAHRPGELPVKSRCALSACTFY
jgi:hypothetical protein